MFTGIIEELGTVERLEPRAAGSRLAIRCAKVLSDSGEGASIAVNGVCLTAVDLRAAGFSADLAPETLKRTNLGALKPGSIVNLERPMQPSGRLSGHIVQGHVDGVGEFVSFESLGDQNWWLKIRVPKELDRYVVWKGSICIDGISLTVASLEADTGASAGGNATTGDGAVGGGSGGLGGAGGVPASRDALGGLGGEGGGGGAGSGVSRVGGGGGGAGLSGGRGGSGSQVIGVPDGGGGGGGFGGGGGAGSGAMGGGGGGGGFGGGGGGAGRTALPDGFGGGGGGFGGGGGGGAYGGSGGFGGGGASLGGLGGFGGGAAVGVSGSGGGLAAGGAIFIFGGSVTLANSTLTTNTGQGGKGGIAAGAGFALGGAVFNLNGTLSLYNATLSHNALQLPSTTMGGKTQGGALYNLSFGRPDAQAEVHLYNSVLSDSVLSKALGGDLYNDRSAGMATVDAHAANWIESALDKDGSGSLDLSGVTQEQDPKLGELQVSGGLSATRLPATDSPLVGKGDAQVCWGAEVAAVDQRAIRRPMACTLGAAEILDGTIPPAGCAVASRGAQPTGSTLFGLLLLLGLAARGARRAVRSMVRATSEGCRDL